MILKEKDFSRALASLLFLAVALFFSCGVSLAQANSVTSGKSLMEKNGCLHCHFVDGEGGFIGPPLGGIAKYLSSEQIVKILTKTPPVKPIKRRFPSPKEHMSHVSLSVHDANKVAQYLRSLPEADLKSSSHGPDLEKFLPKGFKFSAHEPSISSQKGELKFQSSGCMACHMVGSRGGRLGPKLDGIGALRSRAYIENRIAKGAIVMYGDKEYRTSKYSMPPSRLSEKEVSQITDYLLTLPEDSLETD